MSELGELHHPVEKTTDLESTIHESEKKLGLHTPYDRLREASLFIDKKFIDFAVITGEVDKPERMFGDKKWADYIDARLLAKEYGNQELSYRFIRDLHTALTRRSNPEIAGKLRNKGNKGASYEDPEAPVYYTQGQIQAIEQNPQLTFRREPLDDEKSTKGYIVYPYADAGSRTQELLAKDIAALCDWFNDEKKKDTYDPYVIAGTLQHRLTSLHPFFDSNGTLGRLLMNWSLENDGENPSILESPEDDMTTDEQAWVQEVYKGVQHYAKIKEKQQILEKADVQNESALMGLSEEKAFYDYVYKYVEKADDVIEADKKIRHERVEDYLGDFKDEMQTFNYDYKKNFNLTELNSLEGVSPGME